MKDYNLAVLVDAKTEYTNQMTNLCKGRVYTCMRELFNSAKSECETTDKKEETLSLFQKKLAEIPRWSSEMMQEEYDKLVLASKCDWLHELLTAVFMSHSRILSSVNPNSEKELDLDVPVFQEFLHHCYIDVARCFWKSPYLFDDTVTSYDFQRNRRDCELMIEKSLVESIRKQLPVKQILKNYLGENFKKSKNTIENEVDEEERENLKNMIQKDLGPTSKESVVDTTENVEIEVVECDPVSMEEVSATEPVTAETESIEMEQQQQETAPVELDTLDELSLLEEDMGDNLELELDGLTDLTDSLHDDGVVYGLLGDEEPEQTVEEAVTEELQNMIETQEKDVKKVHIKEGMAENVTVTKINKEPEYNFFSDASQHYVE